jgi:hypothetical protein
MVFNPRAEPRTLVLDAEHCGIKLLLFAHRSIREGGLKVLENSYR